MKKALERLWDALKAFAASKGWSDDDYLIFVTVNREWGGIRVEFLARAYGRYMKPAAFEDYKELMDSLKRELRDEPGLWDGLSVHLAGLENYENYLRFGPNEEVVIGPETKSPFRGPSPDTPKP